MGFEERHYPVNGNFSDSIAVIKYDGRIFPEQTEVKRLKPFGLRRHGERKGKYLIQFPNFMSIYFSTRILVISFVQVFQKILFVNVHINFNLFLLRHIDECYHTLFVTYRLQCKIQL